MYVFQNLFISFKDIEILLLKVILEIANGALFDGIVFNSAVDHSAILFHKV